MDNSEQQNKAFFTLDETAVFEQVQSSEKGLMSTEAEKRMAEYGPNQLNKGKSKSFTSEIS